MAPLAPPSAQVRKGKNLRAKFFRAIPAIRRLTEAVQSTVSGPSKRPYLIGIDGRRLHIRSSHSALNTLLQSSGAVLMKAATVIFHMEAQRLGIKGYSQVLHIHDEAEFEVDEERAEVVGRLFVHAIELAGRHFGMRCPTTGEYKIGSNWAETH